MHRRQFLTLSSAVAGTFLMSQCAVQRSAPRALAPIRSQDGLLQLDLVAERATVNLASRSASLMTYNGQVPGPQIEARAGDQVQIRFTNALAEPTNLHFHGLHIPPTGLADDPFRQVNPGETANYEFTIPADHPGGLFWYHPHYHGLVAQQVFNGLAGLLVVRGAVDQLPALRDTQEAFWVLQDFDLNRQGQVREPMPMFRMWGRQGDLITVNGQDAPTLAIPQGGLLRLRLLNASASRVYRLQLKDYPWFLIATDGMTLAAPVESEELLLAPGERRDLLLAGGGREGTYDLLSLPYDRGLMTMMAGMGGRMGPSHGAGESAMLGQITVPEDSQPMALPATLIPVETLPEPDTVREFVLDHGIDPTTRQPFLINGRAFDHHRVDTQVKLGTVEDWVITNKAGMDHPFHLHTNAFQVISRNNQPEPFQAWRDVVNIPPYETVRIRIPFRGFTGKTVYHCHILDHEDQGMMGIVEMI
ncbi:MAG: multicopper oxidase family protein [Leptolyngbyaceae cyanobacterium SM2_3_12]|nr:multicopper oxidase family protein [Leptolyngbyaceae cyanobacterium SM2_3_12]